MKALYKYTLPFLSYLILAINPMDLVAQETSLNQKQYSKIQKKAKKRLSKIELGNTFYQKVKQAPLEWWKQDYLATMDPQLGRPTPEVLLKVLDKVNQRSSIDKRATPGSQIGILGSLIALLSTDVIRLIYTYYLSNKYNPMPWWDARSIFKGNGLISK